MMLLATTLAALGGAMAGGLAVGQPRQVDEVTVALGAFGEVAVGGALVPVDVDGVVVGYAILGDGAASLSPPRVQDRRNFATRQVDWFGGDEATWRAFVDGAPARLAVTRVLVLGGPVPTVGDPVAVPPSELRALEAALEERSADREHAAEPYVVDLRTDVRVGARGRIPVLGEDDHDLTWREDGGYEWLESTGPHGGVVRATAPRPREPSRPDPGDLTVRIEVDPIPQRSALDLRASATAAWVPRAVTSELDLRVSFRDPDGVIEGLNVDGVDVEIPDEVRRGGSFSLGRSFPAKVAVPVTVAWRDRWSTAGEVASHGATTGVVPIGATLDHRSPDAWAIEVGLLDDSGLEVALAGDTVRAWDDGGRRWLRSENTDPRESPVVAIGAYESRTEAPVGDLPAVRVHVFGLDAGSLQYIPGFTRAVVAWYGGLLPRLPWNELEIVQVHDGHGKFLWTAHAGVIRIQQMNLGDRSGVPSGASPFPYPAESTLAHEIAHQWWGWMVDPVRPEDRWMSETFAELYSCAFVAAAYGREACEDQVDAWVAEVEDAPTDRTYALTGDRTADWRSAAYRYGPAVFYRTLRARVGEQAFWGALDAYARSAAAPQATTDTLQQAFEAVSGLDLDPFFDFQVRGGAIPTVRSSLRDKLVTVTSDVRFGTLEVPVRVRYRDRVTWTWLRVVDGEGTLTLPERPVAVELDPEHWLVARARRP